MVKHHLWKLIIAVVLAATLVAPGVSATPTVFQSPPPGGIGVSPEVLTSTQYVNEIVTRSMTISNGNDVPLAFNITCGESARLALWNKLGSDGEVLHSEIGENGTIVGTAYAYEPAKHGNGYVRKAVGLNYLSFPSSLLDNLTHRGAIELWINPKVPQPVPYEYGVFGLLGARGGFYGVPGNWNVGLFWGDTVSGRGLYGEIKFDENNVATTPDEPTQFVATPFEPFHAAISWDIAGIDGTADKVRVYRDGQVVGRTSAAWNPNGTERYDIILGYGPDGDGFDKFISDNIKIWNYAKTDFSDRFAESPICAPWLTTTPVSGTVSANGSLPIQVTFDATAMQPGTYTTQIIIESNDPVAPSVAVPVTMNVLPYTPNDNFTNATDISETPFYQQMDATGATIEAGEPTGSCGYTPQHTIWYKFTAPANGMIAPSLGGGYYDNTILNIYQSNGEGFDGLSLLLGCVWYGSSPSLNVQANKTYYFQAGTTNSSSGVMYFGLSFTPAPANDDFASAKVISGLPYDDSTDMAAASREAGEPAPSCGYMNKTIWYAYTPTQTGSLLQRTENWGTDTVVAVYTGGSLQNLSQVGCRYQDYYSGSSPLVFHGDAGVTYYFQVGTNSNASVPFHLEVTPPPVAYFYYSPGDPSVFDTVYFTDNSYDPVGYIIQSQTWNLGDGTTATGQYVNHRYAKDGDYTVKLAVTTYDGRTASTTQTIHVKTHDVAITKFTVPQSASVNQTRQIVVGLNSKRYVEEVEVQLYKSVVGGFQWVGTLKQTVPVRPSNRTTDFLFSYTFTKADATVGKVTFKAIATVVGARDALPADNEAIGSPPTKVSR